jgi:hypothetical protein
MYEPFSEQSISVFIDLSIDTVIYCNICIMTLLSLTINENVITKRYIQGVKLLSF